MKTQTAYKDLSEAHELISDLFKWPSTQEEYAQYELSNEELAHFEKYGYVAGFQLLTEDQVAFLNSELAELLNPDHPGRDLFYYYDQTQGKSGDISTSLLHALGAWRITKGFHDVLWNPAFVIKASQLLGGDIRFWHDQLFCKPARHGGVVAWHQDYSYWTRTAPMQHLTCWVGLDDATKENGCLQYIPESHTWGLLEKPELLGEMDGLFEWLTDEQKANFNPVPIELKKGQCTFHHPLLIHGSEANHSEKSRRAFVINVFKDGTHSNSDEEILHGVPTIPKGDKMDGQFFPLLNLT